MTQARRLTPEGGSGHVSPQHEPRGDREQQHRVPTEDRRALPTPPIVIFTSSTDRTEFGAGLDGHQFIAKADTCAAAIARLAAATEKCDTREHAAKPGAETLYFC